MIVVDMICKKSMSKLIVRSAETLGEKTKFLGKSSEKATLSGQAKEIYFSERICALLLEGLHMKENCNN
ncbi:hypothetical protein AB3S75_001026 [Citrus x aurantiifolia]